jgi:hypothetical protein
MVAGFAEVIEREETLVAEGGFEPPTFGLSVKIRSLSHTKPACKILKTLEGNQ